MNTCLVNMSWHQQVTGEIAGSKKSSRSTPKILSSYYTVVFG